MITNIDPKYKELFKEYEQSYQSGCDYVIPINIYTSILNPSPTGNLGTP